MKNAEVSSSRKVNGDDWDEGKVAVTPKKVLPPLKKPVGIPPPKFQTATFHVRGMAPLVIRRFSTKTKDSMEAAIEEGKPSGSKKDRSAKSMEDTFHEARYISPEGWDGFQASSIRAAMVRACVLVGYTMTLAKMSIFVVEDGWDKSEPQIPLVKIIGKPVMQVDMCRVATGAPYITARPAYHGWAADIRIRWDLDQFTLQDIGNLLERVGQQVGIGEGRPFSKNSCGMGWGLFTTK